MGCSAVAYGEQLKNTMESIPKEIELMEQIANKVEDAIHKAIYEPKDACKEELLPWACYLSAVKSLMGIDKVLDFLRYHKPELAEPVEKSYQELLILATASDQECKLQSLEVPKSAESTLKACEDYLKRAEAQNAVPVAKIELSQFAEIQSKALAGKLRYIAQMARKDFTSEKPAETKQGNVNVNIFGDVQAGKLQIAQDAYIHEQLVPEQKKKGIIKKIPYWIYILTAFLATLLTSLHYLGWLEPIKAFIRKLVG